MVREIACKYGPILSAGAITSLPNAQGVGTRACFNKRRSSAREALHVLTVTLPDWFGPSLLNVDHIIGEGQVGLKIALHLGRPCFGRRDHRAFSRW
jgi:hypothetical protein